MYGAGLEGGIFRENYQEKLGDENTAVIDARYGLREADNVIYPLTPHPP